MYRRVLVPLDGSELAECALEHTRAIATGCGTPEVVLLRVVEPLSADAVAALSAAGGDKLREAELANQSSARDYLAEVAQKLERDGIHTSVVSREGNAADEILNYAARNRIDLIIMGSHGKSGVSKWFFGSVSEKVVRHSTVPVLLVASPGCRAVPVLE